MSSEEIKSSAPCSSHGSASGSAETPSNLVWPLSGAILCSREESIAKSGLPNCFFDGTCEDRYTIADLLRDSETNADGR